MEEASPASTSVPPDEDVSLLDLLIVVATRKRLVASITLGMIVLGVLLSLLLPTRYVATTALLPPQQGSSAGSALLAQLGSLGSVASMASGAALGALKNPNDLQVAMMKSRTVEDAMVDRFHLRQLYRVKRQSDARKKLEEYVSIENGVKDGLIRISVSDGDPQRAAAMANGYVEEFKKSTANLAVGEASQRRLFFEQQLAGAKDNLADAEESLKKTEQQTGLVQLDSQTRAVISGVAQIRAQVAAKEVQIRAMRSFATGDNPELRMAEEELAGLEAQQEKMGSATNDPSNTLPIGKGSMQQASLEYVRKLRDVKYYETIFDLLARQYEVAKVDEARQGAIVQVVDKAVVPDRRSSPRPLLLIPAAAAVGLLLGVLCALAAEGARRVASNPAERSRVETLKSLLSWRQKQAVRP